MEMKAKEARILDATLVINPNNVRTVCESFWKHSFFHIELLRAKIKLSRIAVKMEIRMKIRT